MAVITKDLKCTHTSISVLLDQFFKATVKYAPYFAPSILEENRSLGDNNANDVALWRARLKKNIFRSEFRDSMTHGFNKGLAATSDQIWLYNGKNPQDQGDVKSILFSSEMTDMVRKGEYGLPFICLWLWVYYLAMESCKSTWVADAVDDYIQSSKFKIVLGTQLEGNKVVILHS